MPRPISPSEADVLDRVIQLGALEAIEPTVFSSLRSLQVTANCKCGCGTLWFGPKGDATVGHMLAHALGSSEGQVVELIVWSQGEAIVGLEVVGPNSNSLPEARSVYNYREA